MKNTKREKRVRERKEGKMFHNGTIINIFTMIKGLRSSFCSRNPLYEFETRSVEHSDDLK